MNKKKTIAVAIILALVLLIGGMFAYFTDFDTKKNVFTLGDNVEISLSEVWNAADGQNIHPGAVVVKAPSIVNDSHTTPAYVFAEVIVPCYDSDDQDTDVDTPLYTLIDSSDNDGVNDGWIRIDSNTVDTTNKTITYVYAYATTSSATPPTTSMTQLDAEATTATPVFSKVRLDPDLTVGQKATAPSDASIVVNAYGIQIDNLGQSTPQAIFGLFNN